MTRNSDLLFVKKYLVESQYFGTSKENICFENHIVWDIGGKITVFDWGEGKGF